MNRKDFLKYAAIVTPFVAIPFIVAYNPFAAWRHRFLQKAISQATYKKRKLVLIELTGGNDGLNTVIPIDKYKILSVARRNILIPENKILPLKGSDVFGFHPSLTGLQQLYNNGLVSAIQGVGYPNPDFSHFRGIVMKYTAHTGKEEIRSGWLGRYLAHENHGYPKGYPLHPTDGPRAIRVGSASPRLTQFDPEVTQDIEDFSIGISGIAEGAEDLPLTPGSGMGGLMASTLAGGNISKINAISEQIKLYSPTIQSFGSRKQNLSKLYPESGKNDLADQLRTVARLIGSGLDTPIYIVSQGDYDTHSDQADSSDTTKGTHANLLKDLSEAITAFEDDLRLMGIQDDVLGMTFSEFGRRIATNSGGTDHGTAETVLLFGSQLRNGIVGTSPELPAKVMLEDNLAMQFDFRSVYKSVLTGWFGVSAEAAKKIIPEGSDEMLDLFTS